MANYIWPLSGTTTPDGMNTSFGPRINTDRWGLHDGMDLPAPRGMKVHAVRTGKVHCAEEFDIVLELADLNDGKLYIFYNNLGGFYPAVTTDTNVAQEQLLGTV